MGGSALRALETALLPGHLAALGTRALARPSPAFKQWRWLPCNNSLSTGTGYLGPKERGAWFLHPLLTKQKSSKHPSWSATRLNMDMSRPLPPPIPAPPHVYIRGPCQVQCGPSMSKPPTPDPTALSQLIMTTVSPMCSTWSFKKSAKKA